jgi:Zn ribbon nucleic-acid-binding protein
MSDLIETLAKIDNSGGTILVRDQEVRCRVRPGTLTDQDRAILAQHRDDILAMLGAVDVDTIPPHSGKTGVMSTSAADTDQDQANQDVDQWLRDNTVEPMECGKCGSLDQWQDLAGGWHCRSCDPPVVAQRVRERAAELRRRRYVRLR